MKMKNVRILNLLLIVIIFLISGTAFSQSSFSEGLAKGKSDNKPILLEIYSSGDSWSSKMDAVFSNEKIKGLTSNFIWVKLDATSKESYNYNGKTYSSRELSKYFGATGFPAFAFLNSDGSVITFKYNGQDCNSFSGYLDAGDFEKLLTFFINQSYRSSDLSKVL